MCTIGIPANTYTEYIFGKSNKLSCNDQNLPKLAGFFMPCIDPQNKTEGQERAKESISAIYLQDLTHICKTFMY
jgi:hypothetical protein